MRVISTFPFLLVLTAIDDIKLDIFKLFLEIHKPVVCGVTAHCKSVSADFKITVCPSPVILCTLCTKWTPSNVVTLWTSTLELTRSPVASNNAFIKKTFRRITHSLPLTLFPDSTAPSHRINWIGGAVESSLWYELISTTFTNLWREPNHKLSTLRQKTTETFETPVFVNT